MKAEHRKELERNALRERMGQVVDTIKSGPKRGSILLWGGLLAVVGIYFAWTYYSKASLAKQSARWTKLDMVTNPAELEAFINENKGTQPARAARFEDARVRLQQGVTNLGAEDQHASAVESLVRARELYDELATETREMPVLAQEAMMGSARAEESLSASPKPDNPSETWGTLDRARERYQELADAYPDTFQGKAAAERARDIQEKRPEIEAFYANLNKQVTKK
jgi:hypothetical protein